MLDPAALDHMWAGEGQRRLARGILRRPRLTEQGLELGAETVIVGAIRRSDGRTELNLKGGGEAALALLSVAYSRPMGDWELQGLYAASRAWRTGNLSLAHIHLAQAGFGPLDDSETAPKRLYWTEKLLDWGMAPRELRTGLDLLPPDDPFDKASPDDPNHPGWPKGSPDGIGGQFRPKDGDAGAAPGIGHNKPPPEEPSKIPAVRPASPSTRASAVRSALIRLPEGGEIPATGPLAIAAAVAALGIVANHWAVPFIKAYFEGPKTLEELQTNVNNPDPAHDIHHIVEQATAEDNDFSTEQEQSSDNLVRITRYQHWDLNRWYSETDPSFDGKSPRDYLRGKDWAECRRVGLIGLRKIGALAP